MNRKEKLLLTFLLVVCAALAVVSIGISGALSSTSPNYSQTSPTPPAAQP
jgi:hypothetical protein